jgi:hypothetical protein
MKEEKARSSVCLTPTEGLGARRTVPPTNWIELATIYIIYAFKIWRHYISLRGEVQNFHPIETHPKDGKA